MTEEEKKAFNFFKGCNEKDLNGFEFFSEPIKKQIKYMETLLNLIEKQQMEIEELLENSVTKETIREKIEELKKAGKTETRNNQNEIIEQHYFLQDEIDILKELLGE